MRIFLAQERAPRSHRPKFEFTWPGQLHQNLQSGRRVRLAVEESTPGRQRHSCVAIASSSIQSSVSIVVRLIR